MIQVYNCQADIFLDIPPIIPRCTNQNLILLSPYLHLLLSPQVTLSVPTHLSTQRPKNQSLAVLPNPLTKYSPSPTVISRFPTPVAYSISIACPSVFQPTRMLLRSTTWCIFLPLVTPCRLYPNFREAPIWPFCSLKTPLGLWLCLFTLATVRVL